MKLLVAQRDEAGLRPLVDRIVVTRLGRGVDGSGRLATDAIDRTLEAVRELHDLARAHGGGLVAVGTSALRDAENGPAFLEPAAKLLGCEVEIIGGRREAELSFRGALCGLRLDPATVTVVDVGGGSTELVRLGRAGRLERESLDIGCVRLTERHGIEAPARAEAIEAMEADIDSILARSAVRPLPPLVANSGTATALAAIAGAVVPYDPARIHGATLQLDWLDGLVTRLASETLAQRTDTPGLDRERADIIVAGAAILSRVCRSASATALTISDHGVRHGLALEIIENF